MDLFSKVQQVSVSGVSKKIQEESWKFRGRGTKGWSDGHRALTPQSVKVICYHAYEPFCFGNGPFEVAQRC